MQVIRLMGMPDKVIAFDELPQQLVEGLEMRPPDGMPRHWKQWLGTKKRITKLRPERDQITGQMRIFEPIVEEGPFFYLVDETLNQDNERWEAIVDYVRRHAPKEFRLKDNLKEMAVPMAPDVRSELKLEPEEVLVIPLDKEFVELPTPASAMPPVPIVQAPPTEAERAAMQNNAHFKTIDDKDIGDLNHSQDCVTFGRGGRYTDGCPKCEAFKLKRQTVAA